MSEILSLLDKINAKLRSSFELSHTLGADLKPIRKLHQSTKLAQDYLRSKFSSQSITFSPQSGEPEIGEFSVGRPKNHREDRANKKGFG